MLEDYHGWSEVGGWVFQLQIFFVCVLWVFMYKHRKKLGRGVWALSSQSNFFPIILDFFNLTRPLSLASKLKLKLEIIFLVVLGSV